MINNINTIANYLGKTNNEYIRNKLDEGGSATGVYLNNFIRKTFNIDKTKPWYNRLSLVPIEYMFGNIIFNEKYWDCEALWLLSLCDHFIISNSTFSWWGAWLSRSDNKIVISPSTWFGPDVAEDSKDIWCDSWIKIPTYWDDGFIKLTK
jgi:hypothetical protein